MVVSNEKVLIKKLKSLVRLFRDNRHAELEVIVGCSDKKGKFRAGTNQEVFDNFIASIGKGIVSDSSGVWSDFVGEELTATYYFSDGVRGRFTGVSPPVFVRKELLGRVDIQCSNKASNLRVTVKNEVPVVGYKFLTKPVSVRLHCRTSVTYKGIWRFEASPVSQGKDKEEACANPETREIEADCLRTALGSLSNEALAKHLLWRGGDILGRYEGDNIVNPDLFISG